MGCWGITAFESDSGLDAVETIRGALPKDGKLELTAAIEALRKQYGALPDVKLAHSHSGPIALADIIAKFVDGDISRLDYDDEAWEQDGKFKEIRAFTATKETLAWLRAYVADTFKIRVAAAAESAKSGRPTDYDFRPEWGGWREERDWLAWQKYLQSLIATLDTLLAEPGESVQIKK